MDCISGTWIAFLADLSVNRDKGMSERSFTNVFVTLLVWNSRMRLDRGVWYAEVLKDRYTPLTHMIEARHGPTIENNCLNLHWWCNHPGQILIWLGEYENDLTRCPQRDLRPVE